MNLQQKKEQTVNRNELETRIKKMYREVALHPEVEYHFEMGRSLTERLGYAPDDLNQIPSEAIDSFAGKRLRNGCLLRSQQGGPQWRSHRY
jgi:arsenite methyltransferase